MKNKPKSFKVDARALLTLGRDSIKDHTTAVVELVKNAYDADAKIVEIDLSAEEDLIRIADTGDGMSSATVEKNWLRIGFSEKREQPTTKKLQRRKTGEKGIGRLSADRLGSKLELRSKAYRKAAVGLSIDWSLFDTSGKDISSIQIPLLAKPTPVLPDSASSGTEMRITNLRQEWTPNDVEKLHLELGLLLPPYPLTSDSFEIRFKNDVVESLNGVVKREIIGKAEIEFDGKLAANGNLSYSLKYRHPEKNTRHTEPGTVAWEKLSASLHAVLDKGKKNSKKSVGSSDKELPVAKCLTGPVRIRMSFFPKRADILEGVGLSLGQLRSFLDKNSGVRIYRDEIRVKPYGDPDSPDADWLSLNDRKLRNPAGAGREAFTIAASNIVGAIFVSRDANPNLRDSSSREGLIEGDEFRQLRAIAIYCLTFIEARYHLNHVEVQGDVTTVAAKAKAAVKDLRQELSTLKSELVELQSNPEGATAKRVVSPLEQIEIVLDRIAGAEKQIDEIASQNTVFRGLASVGIASAVFGHETEISTASAQSSITLAKLKLESDELDVPSIISDLVEAEESVQQIASWGSFALLRVKKDKRQKKKVSITKIVNGVLDELRKPLITSHIELKQELEDISARTFPMDVEAVVINFLTNAYHAVKSKSNKRSISVKLVQKKNNEKSGFEIQVADSGHGFDGKHAEAIWQPLFSTRIDEKGRAAGTGLGLTIVKSAVEELGGKVNAIAAGRLGGAEFSAWFPQT